MEKENYNAPEQGTKDVDAPGSPEPQKRDADDSPAIDQFLADKRHLRFEDTANNWDAIADWLSQHDLPVTVCSLALSYEQLSESGELELTPLARERAADELTVAEVKQRESAERAKSAPPAASTSQS